MAVPTAVSAALTTMAVDALTVAGLVLVAVIAVRALGALRGLILVGRVGMWVSSWRARRE